MAPQRQTRAKSSIKAAIKSLKRHDCSSAGKHLNTAFFNLSGGPGHFTSSAAKKSILKGYRRVVASYNKRCVR